MDHQVKFSSLIQHDEIMNRAVVNIPLLPIMQHTVPVFRNISFLTRLGSDY